MVTSNNSTLEPSYTANNKTTKVNILLQSNTKCPCKCICHGWERVTASPMMFNAWEKVKSGPTMSNSISNLQFHYQSYKSNIRGRRSLTLIDAKEAISNITVDKDVVFKDTVESMRDNICFLLEFIRKLVA